MILLDSSVWVNHFRQSDPRLEELLARELIVLRPFVLGDLACGNLRQRSTAIAELRRLPKAALVPEKEVHHLLESHSLWGKGLGWIDVHLLASALIDRSRLWTADRGLAAAAHLVGVHFPTNPI